jgi:hypothetical protein
MYLVASRSPLFAALGGAALIGLLACGDSAETAAADEHGDHAAASSASEEAEDLSTLRQVIVGFEDISVARTAGYDEQITTCWYHSTRGGQGYHFGRTELIDGTVTLTEPELVMYAPRADGTYEFLGVEYIVPISAWSGAEPPTLLGRQFMRNEQLQLYVLHVWLGKENPEGLYADWNPNVSCEHAAESEDRA